MQLEAIPRTGTPVILSTPINIGKEQRFGFELTLNYSQAKMENK
jgi:hypothetical protein